MAFPSEPTAGDTHTENGIEYSYSKNNYWKRNRKSLHASFEQALKDIETLKAEVTALKG